jgi:lipopolysaccharide assembly protein A
MRWIHTAVVALFVALVIDFAVENFQIVTMSFLGFSMTVPMVLQVVVVYLLGMATGSSLLALLRRAIEGARRPTADTTRP